MLTDEHFLSEQLFDDVDSHTSNAVATCARIVYSCVSCIKLVSVFEAASKGPAHVAAAGVHHDGRAL